jgi:hypothetical protein
MLGASWHRFHLTHDAHRALLALPLASSLIDAASVKADRVIGCNPDSKLERDNPGVSSAVVYKKSQDRKLAKTSFCSDILSGKR